MAENAAQGGKTGMNSQTRAILIVGSLIIVALVGVIIALVTNLNRGTAAEQTEEAGRPQRAVVVNEENLDNVVQELERVRPVEAGYYQARMSTTWNFPDGVSASPDAYVENVVRNTHDVYFDVELADTGETIYASPVIPRGGYLSGIVLDKELEAGSYKAVVIYHLIDSEQNTLSTLRMAITINVEN